MIKDNYSMIVTFFSWNVNIDRINVIFPEQMNLKKADNSWIVCLGNILFCYKVSSLFVLKGTI